LLSRRSFIGAGAGILGTALFPELALRAQQVAAQITTTDLGGGLYLLGGAGCNVLGLRGDDGALLVDGGLVANAEALLRAVYAATGTTRVNTLINTHWHPEAVGANELVGRAGGKILAHEKTAMYLGNRVSSVTFEGKRDPLPEVARPTETTRAEGSLSFAGHRIAYGYLPAAHTDGDLFVHFADLNVMAAGGVVSAQAWPLLDYRNGAWLGGRVRAVERLASLVKADTRIVPADGRMMTGRDVMRQREIYDELFVTMINFMNKGYGAEDVVRDNPLKQYQTELGDPSAFLDGAYRSMLIAYVPD
jgi:glyoxylase-like metal-dependent hydrolase (beta-lactamase superfamily II)